ncbi:MAG: MFS transporter [Phenylobacterium sp.]|uniref:MFS transporter n=1 Tax=Phenylobacterium sp. TaxID=1871053 RepID=UPI0027350BFA|nr:MFS transporter [Phenylobacterium sp.]MDP3747384.1 MFS transporter [Phenylobacterium sp.]
MLQQPNRPWFRNAPATAAAAPVVGGAYAWYVVAVLVVAYTFSFLDRQILSLLVEPMKRDLSLSDTQISLLQGLAFASFNALAGLPLGRLVDTTRRTTVIAAGVAFWSLMTVGCGLVKSYALLLLMRMGVGAGEATLTPAAHSMIGDYFPPHKVGLPLAVYSMGIFVGGGLALVIGATVIAQVAVESIILPLVGTIYGWQLVFLIVGAPGLLVALWAMTLREPARTGPVHASGKTPIPEVWAYLKDNWVTFASLNLGFAVLAMMSYGLAAWIPTFFIREHGWSAVEIGHAYGLIYLVFGPLGVLCGGLLGDFTAARGVRNARLVVTLGVVIATAPFLTFFPLVADAKLALALLAGAVFFKTFINGLAPALLLQMVPNQMRGLGASASLLIINLVGLGLGPTSIALFTDLVLGDEQKLGVSLVVVPLAASVVGFLLLTTAYKPYLRTLGRLAAWNARAERAGG